MPVVEQKQYEHIVACPHVELDEHNYPRGDVEISTALAPDAWLYLCPTCFLALEGVVLTRIFDRQIANALPSKRWRGI